MRGRSNQQILIANCQKGAGQRSPRYRRNLVKPRRLFTINTEEVARTFKRVAGLIELDSSRPTARISGHSTRIGAAQDLTVSGAALPEIMIAGGWKSPQMPTHYARKLDVQQGAMRRWTDSSRKRD
jgi:hypothetical protein